MSGKRFTNHDDTIIDTDGEQLISTDEIVDKMNELADENEQLKFENKNFKRINNICEEQISELRRLVHIATHNGFICNDKKSEWKKELMGMTENNDFNNIENDSTNSRNEKRFELIPNPQGQVDIIDYVESDKKNAICIYNDLGVLPFTSAPSLCDLLNELHEEKEFWKSDALNQTNENQILHNEISILMSQGAEPSDAFKKYLDSISTEYDKFWQRKLQQAKKEKVIK